MNRIELTTWVKWIRAWFSLWRPVLSLSFSVFRSVSPSLSLTYFQFLYRPCHIKTFNKDYGNNLKATASKCLQKDLFGFSESAVTLNCGEKKRRNIQHSEIQLYFIFSDVCMFIKYCIKYLQRQGRLPKTDKWYLRITFTLSCHFYDVHITKTNIL